MKSTVDFALKNKIAQVSGLRLMEIANTVIEYDKDLNLFMTKSYNTPNGNGQITHEQYHELVRDKNNKNIVLYSRSWNFATVENQSDWFGEEVEHLVIH